MITMAIKYVVLPEQKKVIAILENTAFDAYNKVLKICRQLSADTSDVYIAPNPDILMMPNIFKGIAVCLEEDEFDVEEGKRIAKEILMKKYYKSLDKRIDKFTKGLDVIFNTYSKSYDVDDMDIE